MNYEPPFQKGAGKRIKKRKLPSTDQYNMIWIGGITIVGVQNGKPHDMIQRPGAAVYYHISAVIQDVNSAINIMTDGDVWFHKDRNLRSCTINMDILMPLRGE